MLNRGGESGHPCVLDLGGKAFNVAAFSTTLAVGLSYMTLNHVEVCSFYTHFVESFYHERMLNFVYFFLQQFR